MHYKIFKLKISVCAYKKHLSVEFRHTKPHAGVLRAVYGMGTIKHAAGAAAINRAFLSADSLLTAVFYEIFKFLRVELYNAFACCFRRGVFINFLRFKIKKSIFFFLDSSETAENLC
ncbi:MAG: hypothetical protein IJL70_06985 [Treponema sp.]|nr:hypothetical protein [Treponema sp.]